MNYKNHGGLFLPDDAILKWYYLIDRIITWWWNFEVQVQKGGILMDRMGSKHQGEGSSVSHDVWYMVRTAHGIGASELGPWSQP
jgi:hypothetical protein